MRKTSNSSEVPIYVVGSSKFGRYPKINSEVTYNMYESDGWLLNFPGYKRVLELAEVGQGRGLFRSFRGDFMIAVVNSVVYRIGSNFATTIIGQLETTIGEVYIDENLNSQICIVDGIHVWIYNYSLGANLTKQCGGALGSGALIPSYVTFHDTFFLIGNKNRTATGGRWYAYEYASPTTIQVNADLAFQTKPDYPLAVKRIPGQANNVLVLGSSCCEVHTAVGGLDLYRRNSSVSIDYGCLSVNTIAASDQFVAWLGVNESNSPAIMVLDGQSARRVSTDGIDYLLESLQFPAESTALLFRKDGHLFYQLTFYNPVDNVSLIYDFNNQKFYHVTDGNTNYHPASQVVYFNKTTYFVSLNNGSIYEWDSEYLMIDENIDDDTGFVDDRKIHEIPRIRVCNTVRTPNTAPFRANSFTFAIDMGNDELPPDHDCIIIMIAEDGTPIISENGIQVVPEGAGIEDCEGTPYQGRIDVAVSGNGGETWSNYVSRDLNPQGYRRNILRWESMGMFNELTIKIRFWTLGRVVCYNGVLEVH
jgi:hypothetical protein